MTDLCKAYRHFMYLIYQLMPWKLADASWSRMRNGLISFVSLLSSGRVGFTCRYRLHNHCPSQARNSGLKFIFAGQINYTFTITALRPTEIDCCVLCARIAYFKTWLCWTSCSSPLHMEKCWLYSHRGERNISFWIFKSKFFCCFIVFW